MPANDVTPTAPIPVGVIAKRPCAEEAGEIALLFLERASATAGPPAVGTLRSGAERNHCRGHDARLQPDRRQRKSKRLLPVSFGVDGCNSRLGSVQHGAPDGFMRSILPLTGNSETRLFCTFA